LLILFCFLVLGITLSAGLWPFSSEKVNEVWWRPDKQGLYLGENGMVVSDGSFSGIPSKERGYSVEIWMEPQLTWDSNTILTFYDRRRLSTFVIRQSGDDLSLSRFDAGQPEHVKPRSLFLDHVFRKGQKVLVTFSSTPGTVSVYLNGVLRRKSENLEITGTDFNGILVVGNSPYGNSSLSAILQGLAFYDRALGAEEVAEHYRNWQDNREVLAARANLPYALYLFNEQQGTIVRNVGRAGPDLVIPKNYFILEHTFLEPFWSEYQPTRAYVEDLAVNIFGLVPLGMCFGALFAWLISSKRALLLVTVFGFCVSLTIEILQAFMPTRLSGTTDLITNTLGTALGGWLYLNGITQPHLRRWGLTRED
jgi:VanZ family protein